jgi:hypothetical protein
VATSVQKRSWSCGYFAKRGSCARLVSFTPPRVTKKHGQPTLKCKDLHSADTTNVSAVCSSVTLCGSHFGVAVLADDLAASNSTTGQLLLPVAVQPTVSGVVSDSVTIYHASRGDIM